MMVNNATMRMGVHIPLRGPAPFLLDAHAGVGWLNHTVVQFLTFLGIAILFLFYLCLRISQQEYIYGLFM